MAELGKLWAGRAYGTNTGNLFLEAESKDGAVSGILRFLDTNYGLVVFEVIGKFDGSILEFRGDVKQEAQGLAYGQLQGKATLTPTGTLRGQWSTSLGTGGTFEFYPHDVPQADAVASLSGAPIPEQLYTQRMTIGAVRLYAPDVKALVQCIKRDFSTGRVVVAYKIDSIENARYIEDFEIESTQFKKIDYLRLFVQEPEAYGLNKSVTVELNAQGANLITVQGIVESWVIGKAEAVTRQMRRFEKPFVTNFKKWGGTLNSYVFVAMLLLAPEVHSLLRRLAFAGVVLLSLWALFKLHQRYIPTAAIYMSSREPSVFERAWPSVLSWLIAATATLASAFAFYWLKGAPLP